MKFGLSITQKGLIFLCLPLALQIIFFGSLVSILKNTEEKNRELHKSRELIAVADGVLIEAFTSMGSLVTYLNTLEEQDLQVFKLHKTALVRQVGQLEGLVEPGSKSAELSRALFATNSNLSKEIDQVLRKKEKGEEIKDTWDGFRLAASFRSRLERMMVQVSAIIAVEKVKAGELQEAEASSKSIVFWIVLFGFSLDITLTLLLANFFYRNLAMRAKILAENTSRFASGRVLLPRLKGQDELAQLDFAFREMSATIQESSQKERALVESSRDIICSLGKDLRFVSINPSIEAQLGYDPESLLGSRFVEIVCQSDRDALKTEIVRMLTDKKEILFECGLLHKKLGLRQFRLSGYFSDKEEIVVLILHDITDKKIAQELLEAREKRIRSLFDQMPVALFVLNDLMEIESCNLDAAVFLQCDRSQVEGRNFRQLITSQSQDAWQKACDSFATSAQKITVQLFLQSFIGRVIPMEFSLSSYSLGGEAKYLVAGLDITDRLKNEQLKRDFVNMISHDIRTPVTSIIGFLELLQRGKYGAPSEELRTRVVLTIDSANRLVMMVSELLDLEKLEAQAVELNIKNCEVCKAVRRSFDSLAGYAEKREVYLSMTGGDVCVSWDEERVIQVLVNLIGNAIKYSPPEGEVKVEYRVKDNWLQVSVTDQGKGIPESQIPGLFDKFSQGSDPEQRKGGTGLGLAIARAIVECHGGFIGADSIPDRGSRFWFAVPLQPPIAAGSSG